MKKYSSKKNGKKGGRPKFSAEIKIKIPNTEFVVLTPEQYGKLIKKYGQEFLSKAIEHLENWLKTSPYGIKHRGKNNYGHFRSDGWLINSIEN